MGKLDVSLNIVDIGVLQIAWIAVSGALNSGEGHAPAKHRFSALHYFFS
jgi:hypothetical protein